jgi:hypothetical protein
MSGGGQAGPAAGADEGANPIIVDPGKGFRVTLPVPMEVLGKLGGRDELAGRLRLLLDADLGQQGTLAPEVSDKLAAAYNELLHHLEALAAQESRE